MSFTIWHIFYVTILMPATIILGFPHQFYLAPYHIQQQMIATNTTLTSSTATPVVLLSTLASPILTNNGWESAQTSLAAVPLVVLSVLVIGGMLTGIIYFIVQKHRQMYYQTI